MTRGWPTTGRTTLSVLLSAAGLLAVLPPSAGRPLAAAERGEIKEYEPETGPAAGVAPGSTRNSAPVPSGSQPPVALRADQPAIRLNPDGTRLGLAGRLRHHRWTPLRLKLEVPAAGDDDYPLSIEVTGHDMDGDRVLYSLRTTIAAVRGRTIETCLPPTRSREEEFPLVLDVRHATAGDVLLRETIRCRARRDWTPDEAPDGTTAFAVAPQKRLVLFLRSADAPGSPHEAARWNAFRRLFATAMNPGARGTTDATGATLHDRRYEVADLAVSGLPETTAGLDAADIIVWSPEPRDGLSGARQRVLIDWVSAGGTLIVLAGRGSAGMGASFPFAHVVPTGTANPAPGGLVPAALQQGPAPVDPAAVREALRGFAGFNAVGMAAGEQPVARLRPYIGVESRALKFSDVRVLLSAPGLRAGEPAVPLIVDGRFGAGTVVFSAVSPADPPLTDWPAVGGWWRAVLGAIGQLPPVREIHAHQWADRETRPDYELETDAVVDLAVEDFGLAGVRAGALLLLLPAYALLAGPGIWLVLRSYGLLRWSWPIFAGFTLAAGLAAYLGVSAVRGVNTHLNRMVIAQGSAEGGTLSGMSVDCIYCPGDGVFRVRPPADGWTLPLLWGEGDEGLQAGGTARCRAVLDPTGAGATGGSGDAGGPDSEGRRAPVFEDVAVFNHVKKFLTRWWGAESPGRLEVGLLRATVSADYSAEVAEPFTGRPGFGGGPTSTARQCHAMVEGLDWRLTNRLGSDLEDAILVVWPHLPGSEPRTVISVRGDSPNRVGRPSGAEPLDTGSTQGAVVLRLGKLAKDATVAGTAAVRLAGGGGAGQLTTLRTWLDEQATRHPRRGQGGARAGEFPLEDTVPTAALMALRARLFHDPAVERRWRTRPSANTTAEDLELRRRTQGGAVIDESANTQSLAVASGSLWPADLSGRMRPGEAILIARLAGNPKLPGAVFGTRGGSIIEADRTVTVLCLRVPVDHQPGPSTAAQWLPPGKADSDAGQRGSSGSGAPRNR